jgi:Protein of unknown function, DUF488
MECACRGQIGAAKCHRRPVRLQLLESEITRMDQHLLTVGHSNHSLEAFLVLLKKHNVHMLADVRSSPYSKYVTHFDREALQDALKQAGVKYLYLGKELGGRPDGAEFYDTDGHVLYYRLAESPVFLDGIKRLEAGLGWQRIAIMCSEENPAICHRHLLVGRVLTQRGVQVEHIRGDGDLLPDSALQIAVVQRSLFDPPEDSAWKSLRSVSRKKTPSSSSESCAETESDDSSMFD